MLLNFSLTCRKKAPSFILLWDTSLFFHAHMKFFSTSFPQTYFIHTHTHIWKNKHPQSHTHALQTYRWANTVLLYFGALDKALSLVSKSDRQLTTTRWPECVHWFALLVFCWTCMEWVLRSQKKTQVKSSRAGIDPGGRKMSSAKFRAAQNIGKGWLLSRWPLNNLDS